MAEADAAAGVAQDPIIRHVYKVIAADEGNHARLAWRALAWMLDMWPELKSIAAETLNSVLESYRSTVPEQSTHLPEMGLLSPDIRHEIYLEAIDDVIIPCATELGLFKAA